jgi:uncharacterized membrane protein
MTVLLTNLRNAVITGIVLAIILFLLYMLVWSGTLDAQFWRFFDRWLHVLSGVMWIGLLWYFNFVSTPVTPKIPEELRPALGRYITPAALWWFRWAAMATIVTGLILAWLNGYIADALSLDATENFQSPGHIAIGIGMWLGIIMWFNVWFIIWPSQQKALNLGGKFADLAADAKAKAGRIAMLYSRVNTVLSIPMLFSMVSASHLYHVS